MRVVDFVIGAVAIACDHLKPRRRGPARCGFCCQPVRDGEPRLVTAREAWHADCATFSRVIPELVEH